MSRPYRAQLIVDCSWLGGGSGRGASTKSPINNDNNCWRGGVCLANHKRSGVALSSPPCTGEQLGHGYIASMNFNDQVLINYSLAMNTLTSHPVNSSSNDDDDECADYSPPHWYQPSPNSYRVRCWYADDTLNSIEGELDGGGRGAVDSSRQFTWTTTM